MELVTVEQPENIESMKIYKITEASEYLEGHSEAYLKAKGRLQNER